MEVKEIFEALSKLVNVMNNTEDQHELVNRLGKDHRYLQEEFFKHIILKYIEMQDSKTENQLDVRNAYTVNTCKEIAKHLRALNLMV